MHTLTGHTVVCGYGRVGREVGHELAQRGIDFVIVDRDFEVVAAACEAGHLSVHGDATEEPVLVEARVREAKTLIAALDSDTDNTYIALTARALNPALMIVARAGTESAERRLHLVGANRVVLPYRISGRQMALSALQPAMLQLFEYLTFAVATGSEELLTEVLIEGEEGRDLVGQTLAEAFPHVGDVRVLGIARAGGRFSQGRSPARA
ncbi:MAG: hypothetical protein EXR68_01815 [Dehalococcoidia bacterium]|nr:hypothetical protein [Dehalococcoidia bacterium]